MLSLLVVPVTALGDGQMKPIITLSYTGNGDSYTYQIQKDKTVIERAESVITIDYDRLIVENRKPTQNEIRKYPIETLPISGEDTKGM